MGEGYTWNETITAYGYAVQNAGLKRDNATLAARVMELEHQLTQADNNMVALAQRNAELERENTELRADWVDKNDVLTQSVKVMEFAEEFKRRAETAEARLATVPVAAIRYMLDPFANGGTSWAESEAHMNTLTAWIQAQTQSTTDEPDAPLTVAVIDDEDGDE